jgi:hypothetical protein
MGYHLRIESSTMGAFLTTRTRNSELWFINNQELEGAILGYAAKFAARYNVQLFALAIEGNHIQGTALFPECNRSSFMRDLNSCVAKAVPRHVSNHPGGNLWARRYSNEFLPGDQDIESQFFYTVLQPVQDGLVERISDYPGYNCFHDAVHGIKRRFKVVRWAEYNAAKRNNSKIRIIDYTDIVALEYQRLPGYERLTQREYAKMMHKKLEERRVEVVRKHLAEGGSFKGRRALMEQRPGSLPHNTKSSTIESHRPRVISVCSERRAKGEAWYWEIYWAHKEASKRYRSGELDVEFPEGTYRPYIPAQIAAPP